MKHCVIIGGGVIGLASAYYLAKAGHSVTVLDKGDLRDGCSYGNAGMIVPSHIIPLAQPGMMEQGLKWLLDSKSPFYIQPRLSIDLLRWGLAFFKHATTAHVQRSMPLLRDLSLLSRDLYRDLAAEAPGIQYEEKGLLLLYRSDRVGEEEIHAGEAARRMGLEVDFLSKQELPALETGVATAAIGGVHYKSDAHLYPDELMAFLKQALAGMNVRIVPNTPVTGFRFSKNTVAEVCSPGASFPADEVIVAAGSWTPELGRQLGIRMALLPGKGYSFTLKEPAQRPAIPTILCEGKVAVTPMGADLRFGGTLEITHTRDTKIRLKRLAGILGAIHTFYPGLQIEPPPKEDVWFGFRPCTASGLPVIGRSHRHANVIIAAGHGMMGLSLAPATGKLVEELVSGKATGVNIETLMPR
ncbi:MAG: FAD-dependent oxidoreductase [Saprospiraceae bacterium]|nr:FAD-dependent oxidoreductase [Saprospiraceae bacterium]